MTADQPRRFKYPFGWVSAAQPIAALIRLGALIPVTVFGNCEHPVPTRPGAAETACNDQAHWAYGLCDLMSEHSLAGSDCNRADHFLLRPSDEAMADPVVREAIAAVLQSVADDYWDGVLDEPAPAEAKRA